MELYQKAHIFFNESCLFPKRAAGEWQVLLSDHIIDFLCVNKTALRF